MALRLAITIVNVRIRSSSQKVVYVCVALDPATSRPIFSWANTPTLHLLFRSRMLLNFSNVAVSFFDTYGIVYFQSPRSTRL